LTTTKGRSEALRSLQVAVGLGLSSFALALPLAIAAAAVAGVGSTVIDDGKMCCSLCQWHDISKTTTFLSELVQTCASLHKPKKSASHKLNQLGQNFDKFML